MRMRGMTGSGEVCTEHPRSLFLLAATEQAGDEGTHALMSDYVREQEKTSWMLRAYLA